MTGNGSTIDSYVYDGDGNRVRVTQGGPVADYVGNHVEYESSAHGNTLILYYCFFKMK